MQEDKEKNLATGGILTTELKTPCCCCDCEKEQTITIKLSEYAELLTIKGKYEELKVLCDKEFKEICENVKKENPYVPKIEYYGAKDTLPYKDMKVTCNKEHADKTIFTSCKCKC